MRGGFWRRKEGRGVRHAAAVIFPLLLFFLLLFSFSAHADSIKLNLTYGYQNTAKAGRFLPLRIDMENTTEETFAGYAHVYLAESGSSMYEYRYPALVEAESATSLAVNIALGTGVNQLLVTAEGRDGTVYGSRRIGLDVASSDAELIIGLLSERADALSYFQGVSLYDGLLRSRTVQLDPEKMPQDETELDQLDLILISDFELSRLKANEAAAINRWVSGGGTLLLGSGSRGNSALSPYYDELLRTELSPGECSVDMGVEADGQEVYQSLYAAPVYLFGGRERLLSDGAPMLSVVSRGAGLIAVSAYDFCELQRFGTEQPAYVDLLLREILGERRLDRLSVSATEKSLRNYWDIELLLNRSDLSKLPGVGLYLLLLLSYVLLIGPVLRLLLRGQGALRLYRPAVLLLSCLFALLVWVMGINTRLSGSFLTYVRWKDYSADSIDETDILNLRSPYGEEYGMDIKTEYGVYPMLKGTDYTGDLSELRAGGDIADTSISYFRNHTALRIRGEAPFTAKYFELHNKIPNTGEHFEGEVRYFDGALSGTVTNGTAQTLYDAAILLYGRLIRLGRLEPGQTVPLSRLSVETVPVQNSAWTASRIANGSGRALLGYYLSSELNGYFSHAKLIGFFHDDPLDFTENTQIERYGVTMALASLPLTEERDGEAEYPALSLEPEAESGDYEDNTISPLFPAVLSYSFGQGEKLLKLRFESLSLPSSVTEESFRLLPFQGSMSLYNYRSGGYDNVDYRTAALSGEALAPYLNEENVLRIRYTPRDEGRSAFTRLYLPMPIVTAEETEIKENGTVPVIRVQNGAAVSADSEEETEEAGTAAASEGETG